MPPETQVMRCRMPIRSRASICSWGLPVACRDAVQRNLGNYASYVLPYGNTYGTIDHD